MNYRAFSAIFVIILTFAFSAYSQLTNAEYARRIEQARMVTEAWDRERRSRLLDQMSQQGVGPKRKIATREEISESRIKVFRKVATAPAIEDVILSRDFLKQPNTGIFRLFPDKNCLEKGIVRADKGCADIFPESWFYSFRQEDYSNGLFFDLSLKNGKLYTDGFLSLGILAKLGNFSLDNINLESKGAKFLKEFSPLTEASEIHRQYDEFGKGIESDGYIYSREAKAELGGVYLLRVIAYDVRKSSLNKRAKNGENIFSGISLIDKDERKDITVAFRIIKISRTGDLTIIWKELNKKKSPEVVFSN